jgi:hypothetical protein
MIVLIGIVDGDVTHELSAIIIAPKERFNSTAADHTLDSACSTFLVFTNLPG